MLRRDMKPGDVFWWYKAPAHDCPRLLQVLSPTWEVNVDTITRNPVFYGVGELSPSIEVEAVEEDEDPGRPCAWGYE